MIKAKYIYFAFIFYMKRSIFYILFLVLSFSLTSLAQRKDLAKSLLWEISGNDLQHPVYIYGTIHTVCPELVYWSPIIDSVLNSVTKVYFEIDLKKVKQVYLDEKVLAKVDSLIPLIENKKLSTSEIEDKIWDCEETLSYEAIIFKKIDQLKKPSFGLESITSQVFLLNKISNIRYELNHPNAINDVSFAHLMAAYLEQDVEQLYRYMNQFMSFEQGRLMLDKRNRSWVLRFKQITKGQSVFIAVGAGHLAGNAGVLRLLEDKGYKVTPIVY